VLFPYIFGIYNIVGDANLKFKVVEILVDSIIKGLKTIFDCLGAGSERKQKLPFNTAFILR